MLFYLEDRDSIFLPTTGSVLPDCTVLHSRRLTKYLLPSESQTPFGLNFYICVHLSTLYLWNHWFLCPVPADCYEKYKLYMFKLIALVFTVLCIYVTTIFWYRVLQSMPLNIRTRLSRNIENTEPRGLQHNSHLFNHYCFCIYEIW